MLRVAIIGSHSTGKSTLVQALGEALAARGRRVHVGPEPIRALNRRLVGLDEHAKYLALIAEHFRRLFPDDADIGVYDRSLLDLAVYLKNENPRDQILAELVEALLPGYLELIHLVLILPPEIALEPDERRPQSEAYRRKIDRDLRTLGSRHAVNLTELRGAPAERVAQALAALDRLPAAARADHRYRPETRP